MSRIPVNRCLYLGIGGTGQLALNSAKQRMQELYGEVPPTVRFLSIDTDAMENPEEAILEKHEFRHIKVEDALGRAEDGRAIYEPWLDYDKIDFSRFRAIDDGAGQIRQLGRFVWYSNIDEVRKAVEAALDSIRGYQTAEDQRWDVDAGGRTTVVFFGSMAGGTGAGIMLDLAGLVNTVDHTCDKVAYILLPDVYRGLPNTHYVEENSYAFMREMDYLLSNSDEVAHGPRQDLFRVKLGANEYDFSRLFDTVVLVGNASRYFMYSTAGDIADAVGLAIFFGSGHPVGGKSKSIAENPSNRGEPWDGGKRCLYSGFGVAEAHYPSAGYAEYAEVFLASELLGQLEAGGFAVEQKAPVEGAALDPVTRMKDGFIDDERLRERGRDHSQISEAVLEAATLRAEVAEGTKYTDAMVEQIWDRNEDRAERNPDELRKKAVDARERLVAAKREALRTISQRLVSERGSDFALRFLERLAGELTAVEEEKKAELEQARLLERRSLADLKGLRNDAKEAAGRMFGKSKMEQMIEGLRGNMVKIGRAQANRIRAEEVASFCAAMQREIEDLNRSIGAYRSNFEALVKMAEAEKARHESGFEHTKPFELTVLPGPARLRELSERISLEHFLDWLASQNVSMMDFFGGNATAVFDSLRRYMRDADLVRALEELTIEEILAERSEDDLRQLVRRLDEMAAPLLDWQISKQREDFPSQLKVSQIHLIGGASHLIDGQADVWKTYLGNPQHTQFVYIEDKDRVYVYKVEGCLPIYALANFKTYEDEYDQVFKMGLSHPMHIDKRWEAVLPQLGPEGPDENMWVWALAVSDVEYLNRITQRGNSYSFMHHKESQVVSAGTEEIKLASGREEARDAFLRNDALVAEARAVIEQAFTDRGNPSVVEDIKAYTERLVAKTGGSSLGKLVDEEIAALDAYLVDAGA